MSLGPTKRYTGSETAVRFSLTVWRSASEFSVRRARTEEVEIYES